MPAEPETRRGSWLVYAIALAVALPTAYVLGFGPLARLAYVAPEAGGAAIGIIYAPIFALPGENRLQQLIYSYGSLWLPDGEGIVIPIYSSKPDYRARELIYETPGLAGESASTVVPELRVREEFDDGKVTEAATESPESSSNDGLRKPSDATHFQTHSGAI